MTNQTATTTTTSLSEEQLKTIRGVVREMVNSLVRESGEKEYRREAADELKEKYGLDKKIVNRVVRDLFKDEYGKRVEEFDEYTTIFEMLK